MGASFRKVEQIVWLAGCDLLTIAPDLLDKMAKIEGKGTRRLTVEAAKESSVEKIALGEKTFRWLHNEDAMATEELAGGFRSLHGNARKPEEQVVVLGERSLVR